MLAARTRGIFNVSESFNKVSMMNALRGGEANPHLSYQICYGSACKHVSVYVGS